jgi:hypothetical protein
MADRSPDSVDWDRLTSDDPRTHRAPPGSRPPVAEPIVPFVPPGAGGLRPARFDDAVTVEELDWLDEQAAANAPPEPLYPTGFAEWFAVGLTLLPALLFLPGSQAYRLPVRIGAYAISLVAFGLWWFHRSAGRKVRHPAQRWLIIALAWLVMEIAHPLTNSLTSGTAQVVLYFAIFCPVFWASAYVDGVRSLKRVLVVLLLCNGLNSSVGVLQVYDPDRWMPRELSANFTQNRDALAASTYIGPNGRRIVRPPGLFDTPGAVCSAGTIAALFGLIFFLEPVAWWKRLAALGLSVAGVSAIYLSHVRASFIVVVGMMLAYAAMLFLQNQRARLTAFGGVAVGLVVVGLSLSTILGGSSIRERFSTLLQDDPTELYYESRGVQLEYAFNSLIYNYPLGAGLARWGMMRSYFGNPAHLDSTEVFAEIQPNAWLLDGGVFLLVFYGLALVATAVYDLRLVLSLAAREDRLWAAAVVAANLGTLALVFSFVPFGTASGMQFWFLEGVLHGAMAERPRIA